MLLSIIHLYQRLVSPFLHALFGSGCRFVPSCSEYARLAIAAHGPLDGLRLFARRLCRCHPFHPGGYDPPAERS